MQVGVSSAHPCFRLSMMRGAPTVARWNDAFMAGTILFGLQVPTCYLH